jgi:hypothetical protein
MSSFPDEWMEAGKLGSWEAGKLGWKHTYIDGERDIFFGLFLNGLIQMLHFFLDHFI